MKIKLNGETKEVTDDSNLQMLVEQLELAPERLAIEHNLTVVRRADWAYAKLSEGDSVEIVHFVGGG